MITNSKDSKDDECHGGDVDDCLIVAFLRQKCADLRLPPACMFIKG